MSGGWKHVNCVIHGGVRMKTGIAHTELLVVSSILLVCFNKSDHVDMYIWLCIDVGSLLLLGV